MTFCLFSRVRTDAVRVYGYNIFHLFKNVFQESSEKQEYTEHERRQLLIARLPRIQTLNGGAEITADDREDAERFLIRYYTDKPESERPDRYNLYPRDSFVLCYTRSGSYI